MPSIMSRKSLDLGIIMVSLLCSLLDDFSDRLIVFSSGGPFPTVVVADVTPCGEYCLRLILGFGLSGGSSASSPANVSSSADGGGMAVSSFGVGISGVAGKLGCVST